MKLLLSTLGFSFASALVPILNIEVYLGAVGTRSGMASALGLALVAALGQTVGKVIWFAAAWRSVESDWVQRRLENPKVRAAYDRWEARAQGRPWYAATVLFAAASVGVPPLLIIAAVAGSLHMRLWVFVIGTFVGRALRFYFILAGVAFVVG